jgi:hypothetical protein
MRTLLTDPFPPKFASDQAFSAHVEQLPRTFSEATVLASVDDLLEVGVDGIAEETAATFERGVALPAREAFRANGCKESPEDALIP